MSKLIKSLLVVAGITASLSARADFMSTPPQTGFTVCSAAYVTLGVFASPDSRPVLQQRATQIAMAGRKYDPTVPDRAIELAKHNIAKVNANDPNIVGTIKAVEQNCRVYLKQYGL